MALVSIPSSLRRLTLGVSKVTARGETVHEVFADLEAHYPGLREQICDKTGAVRRFARIFLDGEDIQSMQGFDTPLEDSAQISIVMAISGG
ncbi:MoaD/ThiS family protein [Piscinibacter gummiphilus]|uniref:MoaD/ThiS family protein n=1 Tax=Piscinibacter gummiphilus TaxID=946333 RepID=A0ABZ0D2E2_9BURK|nr:MoaD/ThiS family protein [Piscinibacter gummiphilus]WOB11358.1 MoaD/ThiS family protein [Piscinibacter gummiphilus]